MVKLKLKSLIDNFLFKFFCTSDLIIIFLFFNLFIKIMFETDNIEISYRRVGSLYLSKSCFD